MALALGLAALAMHRQRWTVEALIAHFARLIGVNICA
jgi:hypothetical protein